MSRVDGLSPIARKLGLTEPGAFDRASHSVTQTVTPGPEDENLFEGVVSGVFLQGVLDVLAEQLCWNLYRGGSVTESVTAEFDHLARTGKPLTVRVWFVDDETICGEIRNDNDTLVTKTSSSWVHRRS